MKGCKTEKHDYASGVVVAMLVMVLVVVVAEHGVTMFRCDVPLGIGAVVSGHRIHLTKPQALLVGMPSNVNKRVFDLLNAGTGTPQ